MRRLNTLCAISLLSGRINVDQLPQPVARALEPVRRERAIRRFTRPALRREYPTDEAGLRASGLLDAWWYYSAELLPGVVTKGQYPSEMPMVPRLALRRCQVAGQTCLDVGTMEALAPVLLRKRGAREVLAVDFSNHCLGKLSAVQHYHEVDFEYRSVGLMYDLTKRLRDRSFDLVNVSGLLYHVFSPLMLLAAARPLVNRNGIVVVSSWVTLDPAYVMDFNAEGRMWREGNTFWFPSVALLDYLLRYLRLVPIDCHFMPDSEIRGPEYAAFGRNHDVEFGKESGYISVACRAVDAPPDADDWMTESARSSWEYHGLVDWKLADSRPVSSIGHDASVGDEGISLHEAVTSRPPVTAPATIDDSHTLLLSATS